MDVSVSLSRAKQKTFVPQRAGLATCMGKSLSLSVVVCECRARRDAALKFFTLTGIKGIDDGET